MCTDKVRFLYIFAQINKDMRFMIMMDGVHPDMDTCLLVDYKGLLASILETVLSTERTPLFLVSIRQLSMVGRQNH